MYAIRPFRNSDPPQLAEVWCSQPPQRGLAQPVTTGLLELCVFSKQFFDPEGFLVATRAGKPIGFAHASFGPDESQQQIDTTLGTTQLLMMHTEHQSPELADDLIAASEAYQKSRGATVHYAGGIAPLCGFYLGLYGGSEIPGLLTSDPSQTEHFLRNRYEATSEVVVLQRELSRFRLGNLREARRVKRETTFEQSLFPKSQNWWEACVTGFQERVRFSLNRKSDEKEIARVDFWEIEPLASAWGIPTVGMVDLYVDPEHRRTKVATYLLNEALRRVQRRGASLVEAQTMADNAAALALYESLGFTPVDRGKILRRQAD